ncbi:26S proteasome non-ATPase regulatory subunit 6-like [Photinus pyralis]|nr:26S proteasome non-ATPase regulatory subunit 6-like [Photinus pyralis]
MSSTSLDCAHIERVPDLAIAQAKFVLTLPEYKDDEELKAKLLNTIVSKNMAPWYVEVCKELNWERDEELYQTMASRNESRLLELDQAIDNVLTHGTASEAFAHTVAIGQKMDNVLSCIRIGFFFSNHELVRHHLARAEELAEMGVDYEKRNRLQIYRGLYGLMVRDFSSASTNFLATVATFACNELLDYPTFITYTVIAAIYALPRLDLKRQVVDNSTLLQALHGLPGTRQFLFSLYDCDYAKFFQTLANVERQVKENYILHPHYRCYVRDMKAKAYLQFLFSFQSVSFDYMAQQFDVTPEFIETEISQLIEMGKLFAKIDKVHRLVVLTRGIEQQRSDTYKQVVKQGDALLGKIGDLTKFLDSRR